MRCKLLLPALFFIFYSSILFAQKKDSVSHRSNVIKMDLTSQLFYRNSYVFSYERTIDAHHSLAITGGYQELPQMVTIGDGVSVRDNRNRSGFVVGAEYRFYLKSENMHRAPRGVYIGPYAIYHNFTNERLITVHKDDGTPGDASLHTDIRVTNIGFQMGYQFVIAKRFTLDMVFAGPSASYYFAKLDLKGDITVDETHKYQNEIVRDLLQRFPLLEELVTDGSVTFKDRNTAWGPGYRYQFQVGYHF